MTLESGDTVDADVVVSAIGMFNDLAWPDIEGLDSFRGTMFHSARWNWDHDLAGERVAVIGSAASAVQFVPEIVETAGQVHLFQRTANWVLPKLDAPYDPDQIEAYRADPTPMLAFRAEVEANVNKGMTFADPAVNAEREAIGLAAIDVVEGSRGPAQAPADAPVRLQAPADVERLLRGVQRAEPRARHRPHRARHGERASSPPTG